MVLFTLARRRSALITSYRKINILQPTSSCLLWTTAYSHTSQHRSCNFAANHHHQRRTLSSYNHNKHKDDATNLTAAERYQLYFEQMQELQNEQKSLFGNDNDDDTNSPKDDGAAGVVVPQEEYEKQTETYRQQQQLEQLKIEREELYGFTEHDISSWKKHGSNSKHDPAWLKTIEQARNAQQQQQQQHNSEDDDDDDGVEEEDMYEERQQQQEEEIANLTHVDEQNRIHMVDVGNKLVSQRVAIARSVVHFPKSVMRVFTKTENELISRKGPIFQTATIAGIMGAKQTSNLIPLCHPLPIQQVKLDIQWISSTSIQIECTCRVESKTGVEMEALTGATIAALTVYDMVKAVSHNVTISETKLVHKSGGKRTIDKR